jgi:hypothetical protein
MGSKGSKAQAPDPRLVDAQLKSMRQQDAATEEILGVTREFAPLQKEQLQFGLDSARQAYTDSQADREWTLGRRGMLANAQDDIANEANSFDTEAKREELAGQAVADTNRAFESVRGQQVRELNASGINPNSGRALAVGEQTRLQQALALSGGANQARTAARTEGRALKGRVADMLSGYPSMASAQTGAGVSYGQSGVGLTNASMGGRTAGFGQAAGIAGQMGQNATGMFGQQAQRERSMQGQGADLGGIGAILGGGAKLLETDLGKKGIGAALSFFGSDRRLKTDIVKVGQDDRTGLSLYEFAYKTEPARRFRGVMADEVAMVMPGAVAKSKDGYMAVNYGLLGIPFTEVQPGN